MIRNKCLHHTHISLTTPKLGHWNKLTNAFPGLLSTNVPLNTPLKSALFTLDNLENLSITAWVRLSPPPRTRTHSPIHRTRARCPPACPPSRACDISPSTRR